MKSMITPYEIVVRLLLGALIGGIVGFEREVHGRAAGFRTQLIVCVAAVLIMIISENYYFHLKDTNLKLQIDPARISAGALIGIGFLGAGVIIKSGFAVRGLTTAASIWIVSAIGLAIGAGLYTEGVITAVITILALTVLRMLEKKISILRFKLITVSAPDSRVDTERTISSVLEDAHVHVQFVDYAHNRSQGEITYTFHASSRDRKAFRHVFDRLRALDFITSVSVKG